MKRALILLFVLLFAAAALAQPADTVILIPTLYNGPGASGTTWWSWVFISNHSSQVFSSADVGFTVQCPIPEGCLSNEIAGHAVGVIMGMPVDGGVLLHGTPAALDSLSFQARFGALSSLLPVGAELPVVREHEFRTDRIDLPAVPVHSLAKPARTSLRIYGPDGRSMSVRVDLRDWMNPDGPSLASRIVTLQVVPPSMPAAVPVYPAFARLSLQSEFAELAAHGGSFNVSVVPLPLADGELPRIWAFVTVTDEATQLVAVQRPQ